MLFQRVSLKIYSEKYFRVKGKSFVLLHLGHPVLSIQRPSWLPLEVTFRTFFRISTDFRRWCLSMQMICVRLWFLGNFTEKEWKSFLEKLFLFNFFLDYPANCEDFWVSRLEKFTVRQGDMGYPRG
jgi:hypothetical protein